MGLCRTDLRQKCNLDLCLFSGNQQDLPSLFCGSNLGFGLGLQSGCEKGVTYVCFGFRGVGFLV